MQLDGSQASVLYYLARILNMCLKYAGLIYIYRVIVS